MNNTYQQILYNLSVKAYKKGEVPVAALLVKDGKVISKAYNTRHNKKRLLGHAEINCILKGTSKLKTWILSDCDLYVTLEPCNMCKEIINEARIRNVFYYVSKNKIVNSKSKFIKISCEDCSFSDLLSNFFAELRK